MKSYPYLTPYTKINVKWIKDLHIKPETIKLLEENSLTLVLAMIFSDMTPKAQAREAKVDNWGLRQSKKLLYIKGSNKQNEKATYGTGENVCKPYI